MVQDKAVVVAKAKDGLVHFRLATQNDSQIIVTMLNEMIDELGPVEQVEYVKEHLTEDILEAFTKPETICMFLAELDGQIIGFGRGDILVGDPIFRLRTDHRCGYIDQMFVRLGYRDRGIGAHLLRLCEQWFFQQGVEHCILHAAPKAVRFYSRMGYHPNREMFKKLP